MYEILFMFIGGCVFWLGRRLVLYWIDRDYDPDWTKDDEIQWLNKRLGDCWGEIKDLQSNYDRLRGYHQQEKEKMLRLSVYAHRYTELMDAHLRFFDQEDEESRKNLKDIVHRMVSQ